MNISDFARSRSVDPQAVSRYILRHPELQKLTTRVGKTVELTPEAERLLDEVYPLPQPVQVIQGIPAEEYEALQKNTLRRLRSCPKFKKRAWKTKSASQPEKLPSYFCPTGKTNFGKYSNA